jgi:Rieske Fe-S protein
VIVGAAPLLVACGSDDPQASSGTADSPDTPGSTSTPTTPDETTPSRTRSAEPTQPEPTKDAPTEPEPEGVLLATVQDVPVGGGVVVASQDVVVTQPTKGQFRGFSATCTHRGCTVAGVADGTINCPCHGSMYSTEDGSVQGGPAPAALPEMNVVRAGQEIRLVSQ